MFNNGIVNDDNYNHVEKNLKNVLNLANTNQNARAVEEEIYYPGFRVTGSAGRKNTAFPVFFLSLPSLIH